MVLIDAIYIHNSGGKTLLNTLLNSIMNSDLNNYFFLLDDRLDKRFINSIGITNTYFIKASEKNRKSFYKKNQNKFNSFFCFGNVPPPITIHQRVVVYFQNDLILSSNSTNHIFKNKLLLFLKKQYIFLKNRPNYYWAVQTSFMKQKLSISLGIKDERIKVLPFFDSLINEEHNTPKKNSFIYVAGPEAHKNHQKLLLGFSLAAKQSKVPLSLILTLPYEEFSTLNKKFHRTSHNLEIYNLGVLTKEEVIKSYRENRYCIHPSLKESFGLTLIEAAQQGSLVIAADLPYVYEVIEPSLCFNPYSEKDIANIILKAVNLKSFKKTKIKVHNNISNLLNYITDGF